MATLATHRDAVVTLLNAAVAAHTVPVEGWTAIKGIVPNLEAKDLGTTLHVIVLPASAAISRITRGKVQQLSTISVGIIKVILLAGGGPDQDACDGLIALTESIGDHLTSVGVGPARITAYDQELLKQGIYFGKAEVDLFAQREVPAS